MKCKLLQAPFLLSVMTGCFLLASCKKILDVEPQTVLDKQQTYRNVFDADAAVLGVYGKFMKLAKPYVLMNELRADLMSPTTNADMQLQQLSNHTTTADNPYIDPTPFYEVILNCNDVLKNFDIMLADKKLKADEYNQRYSDIASLRTWIYLQLGIHFGNVPYVTKPIEQVTDLHNESLFPKLPFRQLLAELVKTMEALPTTEAYPASATLVTTVDQYFTQKFFINKNFLMGDLYLWNGAYDPSSYKKSATAYRKIISFYDNDANINTQQNYYHLVGAIDPNIGNQLAVQYFRYRESDQYALYESNTDGWRSMFSRGKINYDAQYNWEWIWTLPFNNNFAPRNPFIDLFSNRGGSYLVKPSQQAIDNWNSQEQINGFPFDARGKFSFKIINGQPVIMKFLYYYLDGTTLMPSINSNGRTGEWWLYRAATLWQHFGEAANRDNRKKLAYAIVNQGINTTYTPPNPPSNVTNIQNTFDEPPYDFDARNGDNPQFRAVYRAMAGLRGRAYLKPLQVTNPADSVTQIENMLVQEGALELAFEGQRWADLLRVAIRRNDASFITSKIATRLRKEGRAAEAAVIEAKTIDQLYLPFKWK